MKLLSKTALPSAAQHVYWDMTIPGNHNYVLGNGCLVHNTGVGFSVESQFVEQLPRVSEEFHDTDTCIDVADSKLGWAKAFKELLAMLYVGQVPTWNVSKVRPAGAPLKTFGGRASGPDPLVELFKFCVRTFKGAAGRRLTTLECHDIVCKIAEIVVVGGVRRSALISLSDLHDDRMRHAKNGEWWNMNSQRALSNNSYVAQRERPTLGTFLAEWTALYESKSGERGIFSRYGAQTQAIRTGRRDAEHLFGTNPCSEIILRSREFCNLSEVVVREDDTLTTLKRKVRLATILGTFQSTLTNFRYIGREWQKNCEEERLLGVSLTGIMDSALTNGRESGLEKRLETLRAIAVETNREIAAQLKIPQSAAITCVKPSGCTTLDTTIRTENGIMSMADIFGTVAEHVDLFEMNSGTWIEPTQTIRVYDKNNDLQPVTKLFVNGLAEVYEITDETGRVYKFTKEHKLLTTNGWKRVDQLTTDDDIVRFE